MSAFTSALSARSLWNRAWSLSPILAVSTGVMALGAVLTTLGLLLDSRQLVGEPVWLKPTKFYLSLAAYNATVLYFFSFLSEQRRLVRISGRILAAAGALEMVAITLQAARGVRSHFNVATPFDAAIFSTMGIAITVLWVTMIVLAVALLRSRLADRPLAAALRLGFIAAVIGMGLGYFMTNPNATQLEAMKAGQRVVEAGSHTFGAPDGGPGLPLVGWSTTAGDMRPAHFLGLHAMQVLPILAALLARRRNLSETQRQAAVRATGIAYTGVMLVLAMQALRGLPIVHWDAVGLSALALVVTAALATAATTLRHRPISAAVA
ncbi:hypothetical protein ATI61_11272 [Archangium gephyra]|uniref:Uncharacterized protein n=1 Tax=Archangium gephyra TaxID=48 RepID=A0AAC8Q4I3_9BACT|nr:hypothetical protein [Archangium gephyra]AKJ00809.1 Hypothetical protein AA314_02435 [Archangium gephyra]REG25977.1 hypothetical protein ATI61_11272 [Archangium gephyra]